MRSYIRKNLPPVLHGVRQRLSAYLNTEFDSEVLTCGAIAGSTNKRENIRNCFIFGNVEIEGNGKMVNCFVMPGVTVHIADGTIVADCMFSVSEKLKTVEITLGKDVLVYKVLFRANTKIDDNSTVIESAFGYQDSDTNDMMDINIGEHAFLYHASIQRETYQPNELVYEYTSLANNIILNTIIKVKNKYLHTGNDFCVAQYMPTLKLCLSGCTLAFPTDSAPPVTNMVDFYRDQIRSQHDIMFSTPATLGDRCYIGVSVQFQQRTRERPGNCFIAGDDVNIVPGTVSYTRACDVERPKTHIQADSVRLGSGCTLAIACPFNGEERSFKELRVDENAVLFLESDPVTTSSYSLRVTKQRAIRS